MQNIWNISWNQFYIVSTFKHWWNSIQAPLWCLWGLNCTGRGVLPLSCSWIQFNVCDQTYSKKNLGPWEERQPPWFSDDLTYRNQMSGIPLFQYKLKTESKFKDIFKQLKQCFLLSRKNANVTFLKENTKYSSRKWCEVCWLLLLCG